MLGSKHESKSTDCFAQCDCSASGGGSTVPPLDFIHQLVAADAAAASNALWVDHIGGKEQKVERSRVMKGKSALNCVLSMNERLTEWLNEWNASLSLTHSVT